MDGRTDGWMDGCMDAWMHGWIGRQIYPMMGASYGAQSIRQSTYKPTLIHHNYTFTSMYSYMGGSIHGHTPKWMVYDEQNN